MVGFYPEDPKWCRGVRVFTVVAMTFFGVKTLMFDNFNKNINSNNTNFAIDFRSYAVRPIDKYFKVTFEELTLGRRTINQQENQRGVASGT